ncbi:hypothetical protein HK100_009796 [Physocladia obscura]|uniref:Ketoreductase domain-containing protein n=1 Tax=Physocladia obscura TaxID=109957 RepID=A0AAD5SPF6_9FUNG|nr:hypothetical protein HK100_009796 [Physocladia obscura]
MASAFDNVFVITGGARGIGRATALELAALPRTAIVINFKSSKTEADATVAAIEELGATGLAIQADLSSSVAAKTLIKQVVDTYGKITGLVNNAGVYAAGGIEDVTEESYDYVFDANVKSAIFTTAAAAPHIVDGGAIVTVSSVVTHNPFPKNTVFVASKGALEAFTRALAIELAPRHIRVNAVSPGFTGTKELAPAFQEFAVSLTPFKRVGTPEEVGKAIAFFVGPESKWVTGQNLIASGGIGYTL